MFWVEIIDKRKQLYQKNNDNMKLIYSAISSKNFEQVIKSAGEIEAFANKMTDYFPVGSVSRGSSENIWSNFEGFAEAAKRFFKLNHRPKGKELLKLAEKWKPLRGAAALVMWQIYRIEIHEGSKFN